ncbi:MAG: hypothetical protein L6R45_10090 [Anaerolineae bacterium]|nr:hypothetical protein [Anaerolineae bacterium]
MKALERTTDPEARKGLPVPYEVILYYECERRHCLPYPGSLMEQPHILLLCFRIIEDEAAHLAAEERQRAEINRREQEMFDKMNAGK